MHTKFDFMASKLITAIVTLGGLLFQVWHVWALSSKARFLLLLVRHLLLETMHLFLVANIVTKNELGFTSWAVHPGFVTLRTQIARLVHNLVQRHHQTAITQLFAALDLPVGDVQVFVCKAVMRVGVEVFHDVGFCSLLVVWWSQPFLKGEPFCSTC